VQRRRSPKERDRRYLTALIGWGYQPSDVEQLVLADTTPTDAGDPGVPNEDAEQTEDGQQTEAGDPDDTEPGDAQDEDTEDGDTEPDEDGDDRV
jgi:ParB family chromosome partitioning protein